MKSETVRLSAVVPADVARDLDRCWFAYRRRDPSASRRDVLTYIIRYAARELDAAGLGVSDDAE